MADTQKLDWNEVNTADMKGPMKTSFDQYLKAKSQADEAWKKFLGHAQEKADKAAGNGHEAVLTYKRGKLLVAFREAKANGKSNASANAVTL